MTVVLDENVSGGLAQPLKALGFSILAVGRDMALTAPFLPL